MNFFLLQENRTKFNATHPPKFSPDISSGYASVSYSSDCVFSPSFSSISSPPTLFLLIFLPPIDSHFSLSSSLPPSFTPTPLIFSLFFSFPSPFTGIFSFLSNPLLLHRSFNSSSTFTTLLFPLPVHLLHFSSPFSYLLLPRHHLYSPLLILFLSSSFPSFLLLIF